MPEPLSIDVVLLSIIYATAIVLSIAASIYLLLRRTNIIAPGVTPPLRLRRWTGFFFAFLALSHLWYLPAGACSSEEGRTMAMLIGALLDSITIYPTAIIIPLCMLQDQRRPLWPVVVAEAPLVIMILVCIATCSYVLRPYFYAYLLLFFTGLTVYMVRALKQYRRWLRDNYADLEDKNVWQNFVAFAAILLMFGLYNSGIGVTYEIVIQTAEILLICYLLWHVETLNCLTPTATPEETEEDTKDDIEELLRENCEATQLYLQHDLTVTQLAQTIGINRALLSKYFSRQATTYNNYINTLRIKHFISLYHESLAAERTLTAQQLAKESGFSSYSTFSLAFKQRMGQSVRVWMREGNH